MKTVATLNFFNSDLPVEHQANNKRVNPQMFYSEN